MSDQLQRFSYSVVCTVEAHTPDAGRAAVERFLSRLSSMDFSTYYPDLGAAVTTLTLCEDAPDCCGAAVVYGLDDLPTTKK